MIRVLRIQSRICIGGPALNTIALSAGLHDHDYQTLLVGGRLEPGESSMEPLAQDQGVALHELAEMGRSLHWLDDLRALRKLIKVMRLYKPHIVHTHTAKAGALGRIAALLCRVPVRVHTFHGHVFSGYFGRFGNLAVRWVERLLALSSTAIIAISPSQRDDLVDRFRIVSRRKCHLIRLGFDLDGLSSGEPGHFRAALGLPATTTIVGIIARLVPIKRHDLFLQAVSIWVQRHPELTPGDMCFVVLGDGELREGLKSQCARLGISDWVLFPGWWRDMAQVYADLGLNVLVSKNEGTPVTLIEGMAAGVPALTTDVGGIRDFFHPEAGQIIAADPSPDEIADALDRALNPRPLARIPDQARQSVFETFGVARLVSEVRDLYGRLLP